MPSCIAISEIGIHLQQNFEGRAVWQQFHRLFSSTKENAERHFVGLTNGPLRDQPSGDEVEVDGGFAPGEVGEELFFDKEGVGGVFG